MLHDIGWHDLGFDRVPIEFFSTCGVPQTRWVPIGMPRIPNEIINGVFYLYRDRVDAEAGENPAGTGFVVRYEGGPYGHVFGHHYYGVTNWHVACDKGFSTIRLNAKGGGTDVLEFGPEDWHFLPGKYDVAVVPLSLNESIHDVSSVSTHLFVPDPKLLHGNIGVGEDVFMIGLFIDHDGITKNVPSARFGHVSMQSDPRATIKQPTGYHGESYVVDMHSRTGFSGSPVYVYRTFGNDLTDYSGHEFEQIEIENATFEDNRISKPSWADPVVNIKARGRLRVDRFVRLLGIHWGQFPERWELHDKGALESRQDLISDDAYVEGMSGMTCVIPAWQILEVLDMPPLKELRQPGIDAARKARSSGPKPESAGKANDDANPHHLEDFTRLVDAAARKRPQGDQT